MTCNTTASRRRGMPRGGTRGFTGFTRAFTGFTRALRGFTLVEVLVVVVLVGILLLVALPGYQRQILKTRRAMAWSALEVLRAEQEQYFVNHLRYADDLAALGHGEPPLAVDARGRLAAPGSGDAIYRIHLAGASGLDFTLVATARGDQAADRRCLTLSVNARGVREAGPGSLAECR